MRNLLLVLALQTSAACATLHLPPPELDAPASFARATDEDEDKRPAVLLASADVGATVSDWYVRGILREPVDPNRPTFTAVKVRGTLTFLSAGTGIAWTSASWTASGNTISTDSNDGISVGTGGITSTQIISSSVATGNNGLAVTQNGARIDFGAGASDYASSDGTTVTFAGALGSGTTVKLGTQLLNSSGQTVLYYNQFGWGETDFAGNATNVAGQMGLALYNATSLTAGVDRYIATFYNDALTNIRARIFTDGTYQNIATVGTAASGTGVTAVYSGASRAFVHKVTVTNAAMTAAGTTDITLAVTPSNTRIQRVTANVTQVFTGGALTAVTVMCGNAAGGNQYLLANSVFTAQNTWGDVVAEMGAGLVSATLADFGTSAAGVPGAITVSCRFTCTTANCNAATQGSVTFYVEGVSYQ